MTSKKNMHCAHAALETIQMAQQGLHLLDLTLLEENLKEHHIQYLCQKAIKYKVAGICIYLPFVKLVKSILQDAPIKVVTVVNFPYGNKSLKVVKQEISLAQAEGANEIDLVMPYEDYLKGKEKNAIHFVEACKKCCEPHTQLKVILETGLFAHHYQIYEAAHNMIKAGADFLKTSTGKQSKGATLSSMVMLIDAIKEAADQNQKPIGLKIAGGIRTMQQVHAYFAIIKEMLGENYLKPQTFRIGASALLDELAHYSSGMSPYVNG